MNNPRKTLNLRASSLLLAILFAALPVQAQNAGGRPAAAGANVPSLATELAILKAQVAELASLETQVAALASLEAQVAALGTQVAALEGQVVSLGGEVASLETQVVNVEGQTASLGGQVGSLGGQVGSLEGQVAKLEGHVVEADFVGTYILAGLQNELVAGSPGEVASYVYTGTVELAADGTASMAFTESGHRLELNPSWLSPVDGSEVLNGTWTYANGIVAITAVFDGESVDIASFGAGAGGRVLIASGAGDDGTAVLLILTRLH